MGCLGRLRTKLKRRGRFQRAVLGPRAFEELKQSNAERVQRLSAAGIIEVPHGLHIPGVVSPPPSYCSRTPSMENVAGPSVGRDMGVGVEARAGYGHNNNSCCSSYRSSVAGWHGSKGHAGGWVDDDGDEHEALLPRDCCGNDSGHAEAEEDDDEEKQDGEPAQESSPGPYHGSWLDLRSLETASRRSSFSFTVGDDSMEALTSSNHGGGVHLDSLAEDGFEPVDAPAAVPVRTFDEAEDEGFFQDLTPTPSTLSATGSQLDIVRPALGTAKSTTHSAKTVETIVLHRRYVDRLLYN